MTRLEACLSAVSKRGPGFPELICLLSMNVLLNDLTWVNDLQSAWELYWDAVDQYVRHWLEEAGKVRVLPQWLP